MNGAEVNERNADSRVPRSDLPGNRLLPSLLRIAETSITVGDIAESDLWYVDPESSAAEAHRRMVEKDFDYAPLRDSRPYRYVARAALEGRSGNAGQESRIIDAAHLVTSTLGLAKGIPLLEPEGFYFVLTGDRLSAIVTYADLQKAPVSMVTLALILAAETGINRLIAGWMAETWWDSLSSEQQESVRSVFEQRRRHNTEISLLGCLTLTMRLKLLLKHPTLREEFGRGSRDAFDEWQATLLNLRDTLAHGGTLLGARSDPVEAIRLFKEVRSFTERVWQFGGPVEAEDVGPERPSHAESSFPVARRDLIHERLTELVSGFGRYVEAYDESVPFTSDQLAAHRRTIELLRRAGSAVAAIHGDEFLKSLYSTLLAWGLGTRGSHLAPLPRFADAIRAAAGPIEELESLTIDDPALPEDAADRVWRVIEDLGVVENKAKIVAGTKVLHHLLPELVAPMDRTWTGMFFQLHGPEWQGLGSSQRAVFVRTFESLIEVASVVHPERYVTGEGWRTSRSKIMDNALIGYCKLRLVS